MSSGADQHPDGWIPPWTRRAGSRDEQAFVDLVSDALFVPDAAPEIRMIAEVMAFVEIPSSRYEFPVRGSATVTDIAEARAARRLFGSKAAAAVAAVALALAGLTASAYAGVLPGSLQDVAHHVIDAPPAQHDHGSGGSTDTPGTGGAPNRPGSGPVGSSGSAPSSHPSRGPAKSPARSAVPASPSGPVPRPSHTHGHGHDGGNSTQPATTAPPTPPTPTVSTTPSAQGGAGPAHKVAVG